MAHDAKRDALIGRFRAGALVRVRQTALLLAECERGQATREHVETVGRELHTLKGEARMLGFVALSELVHRAEDHAHAGVPGTPPPPEVCRRLLDALAVVTGFLSGDANEQALDAAARNLGSTEAAATATELSVAHQEVFHDEVHVTAVHLPVWNH